ncbi:MAG TPA: ribonuclease III [Elusimicrobia bacterium]|nr:ribonuclease III [Elusimicrobiota bacterium]HBT61745.1 ribonuclease III [Elusimicrobiota bacterium]
MSALPDLEDVIGYRFRDSELLKEALSHKSYASESRTAVYNERLEFLGDSILAAVVAHELYTLHPDHNEGDLSKKKAQIVSRPSLAHWAAQIDLGSYLRLGVGEESSGGRSRQSLLANAFEALVGAIYLDGGYGGAADFIRRCLGRHEPLTETDYKSLLQEVLQKKHKAPPTYEMVNSQGPDHDKTFAVQVHFGKRILGHGEGKTKKEAEQAAAKDALGKLAESPS